MADKDSKLLIRIDERTQNIWKAVEKIEKHAAEQNGYIREITMACSKNTTWRKVFCWIIGIGVPVCIAWLLHLEGLF